MPFPASVIKVMIASPSDVTAERQVIREVIDDWNAEHAEDRGLILMDIGWESHASPEMGDRPQEIINRQLLRDADLLVAVFWARLGTPTGLAPSGTVEEIVEHLGSGKPAMLYFSSVLVDPDVLDHGQHQAVRDFKEACRARGLVGEYRQLSDFRAKFRRELGQTVVREFSGSTGKENKPRGIELSQAAQELLLEACRDDHGMIVHSVTAGGTTILTNSRNFTHGADARAVARWRGALSEIERKGLIEDQVGKGQVYFLTDAGFQVAEGLSR